MATQTMTIIFDENDHIVGAGFSTERSGKGYKVTLQALPGQTARTVQAPEELSKIRSGADLHLLLTRLVTTDGNGTVSMRKLNIRRKKH